MRVDKWAIYTIHRINKRQNILNKPLIRKLKRLLTYKNEIEFIIEQERERILKIIELDIGYEGKEVIEHIREITRPQKALQATVKDTRGIKPRLKTAIKAKTKRN